MKIFIAGKMPDIPKLRFIIGIIVILFCFNILVWIAVFQVSQPRLLKVVFFDIGQGDAIFIETPRKTQILIDGGPSGKVVEKLGQELPFSDRSIDLIIATHPDKDHISGLVEVLKSYQVGLVGTTGIKGLSGEFNEFTTEIENNGSTEVILKKGQKIIIGQLAIEVFAPLESFEGREVNDTNVSSLVLKAVYGNNSFLLTGDAPQSVEKKLVQEDISSQVLKVGHHGSASSSSDSFLQKVNPEFAVIQVGQNNSYGHPAEEVLERLEKYGIMVMRTDQLGDISFLADGQRLLKD
ncbi:MBL fold metallo-hydrolase [Patescibacteria group bacterium]|nr:MBL fold metallo-hydrolase [Patescibacteria group bacterium]MBU4466449.1 MBL fold metallo-hydrolase [Patescibacteria group bacterium]